MTTTLSRWMLLLLLTVLPIRSVQAQDEIFHPEQQKELVQIIPEQFREKTVAALLKAGENWPELAEVIRRNQAEEHVNAACFLIANMPSIELATIGSVALLEHITYAYRARREMPWGQDIREDLFCHFILPYRVAREPGTKWRKALFEELTPRVIDLKSISEVALELNRWVKEKTSWRTRRLDQVLLSQRGPLQILRSGWGNCEEQTILYVAAARAVGIPARQAFCWWSTTEGYHAWTEVWDGSGWRYLGSGEPAEKLNQAWFSQTVSEVPRVYAYSFAHTPLKTEMLGKQIDNLLDVTSHYTTPGKLAVKVVQENGPAAAVPVHMMVYNLGAFRSVAQGITDQLGQAEISIGKGKYMVSAGTPEHNDWKCVQIDPQETTMLSLDISNPQNSGIFAVTAGVGSPEAEAKGN